MAFFLSNSNSFSRLRFQSNKTHQESLPLQLHRGFLIELGEREKALLADDPVLKNFKSYKPTVRRIRTIGNALTVVIAAACCYEIYLHAVPRASEHGKGQQS